MFFGGRCRSGGWRSPTWVEGDRAAAPHTTSDTDAVSMPNDPLDIESPHEILGLPADERDPVRIVEAASIRLQAIQSGRGSHREVRRTVTALIRMAREAMLREACDP